MLAGDILVVSGTSWLSRQIEKATDSPASHVGVIVKGPPTPIVIEALSEVMRRPLCISVENSAGYWLLEALNVTDLQRQQIVSAAAGMLDRPYSYWKIGLQGIDAILHTRWFTEHLSFDSMHPICSMLVADSYAMAGLDFGIPDNSITPADILNFAEKNPDKYRVRYFKCWKC